MKLADILKDLDAEKDPDEILIEGTTDLFAPQPHLADACDAIIANGDSRLRRYCHAA